MTTDQNGWDDPFAARESGKYERPIPSRELILATLERDGQCAMLDLAEIFSLTSEEDLEALRRRLGAMVRDGQIQRNRRGDFRAMDPEAQLRGRVRARPEGWGLLIAGEGREEYVLRAEDMQQVFDGDVVQGVATGFDRKGRAEARIVKVVERHTQTVVGRYEELQGVRFVVPDHPRILHDILVEGKQLSVTSGQLVVVQITRQPGLTHKPVGEIIEVLGDYMAPGMEIDIAVRTFGLPHLFSEAVKQEVANWTEEVAEADKEGREDLRDLPLVTIDGEDARDFDDAVYAVRRPGGGFRLVVAIADVAHYVRPGMALDREALERGTSVYFPGSVIPMLPEVLSNGLCSLKPEVDRLCVVCDMTFSRAGRRTGFRFYWAVMHSHARLTYQQVQQFLHAGTHPDLPPLADSKTDVARSLLALQDLFLLLRAQREERGALDFEAPETRIIFNAERKIERIVARERIASHQLIEECMLAANVCAAEWALEHEIPVLFRNHQGPTPLKLAKLQSFLNLQGLTLPRHQNPKPEDYQQILTSIQDRPDRQSIEVMILRSMAQAFYGSENLGHFGLNYEAYAHFTSPIRRYPDLLLHRALMLHHQGRTDDLQQIRSHLAAWGEQCSVTERRADEAARDVVAWLKCEFMQDRVGEVLPGRITAVLGFGMFVELLDDFVEGMVHVSQMGSDYFVFDERRQALVGEMSGQIFRMGDQLDVEVLQVDLDQRRIDFRLVGLRVSAKPDSLKKKAKSRSHGDKPRRNEDKAGRKARKKNKR